MSRTSEAPFQTMVSSITEGILVAMGGRIVFANPSAERLIGRPLAELQTTPFTEFIHPDDQAMVIERYRVTADPPAEGFLATLIECRYDRAPAPLYLSSSPLVIHST